MGELRRGRLEHDVEPDREVAFLAGGGHPPLDAVVHAERRARSFRGLVHHQLQRHSESGTGPPQNVGRS